MTEAERDALLLELKEQGSRRDEVLDHIHRWLTEIDGRLDGFDGRLERIEGRLDGMVTQEGLEAFMSGTFGEMLSEQHIQHGVEAM